MVKRRVQTITALILIMNAFFILFASSASAAGKSYYLISNESINGNNTADLRLTINTVKITPSQPASQNPEISIGRRLDINRKAINTAKTLPKVGDWKSFWVDNLSGNSDSYKSKTFQLLYSQGFANVWVSDSQLSKADAARLGVAFNRAHNLDVQTFGHESDIDHNGKVNLLCFDIQDGYKSGSDGYVAGYFDPGDLYADSHSNQSEVIYMDTYPAMGTGKTKNVTDVFPTLAHEFQHMISFNQNVFIEKHSQMDVWIDEGLSMMAEQMYSGQVLSDQIEYYNESSIIADGQSLLYWGDHNDLLANYALSYLFMEYLRIQCGQGNSIFKNLINDKYSDYRAVQNVIRKYIDPRMTFGQFMTDFRAALFLNQRTGRFSFHNESGLSSIDPLVFDGNSLRLRGGAAVVAWMNTNALPKKQPASITYTNLSASKFWDFKAPAAPAVQLVTNHTSAITGSAERNAVLSVYRNGTLIKMGNADAKGNFHLVISRQAAGTELKVFATDVSGNRSSARTVKVLAVTKSLKSSQIKVTNNKGRSDKIVVTGLKNGDVLRIYHTHWKSPKTVTATKSSKNISIKQLGKESGSMNITLQHSGYAVSGKTKVAYQGEKSSALKSNQIKITNNKYSKDLIKIIRIKKDDWIRVYNQKKKLIAKKKSKGKSLVLYVKQLGKKKGYVYMTTTHQRMRESGKKVVYFKKESS